MKCKRLLLHGMAAVLMTFTLAAGIVVSPVGTETVKAYDYYEGELQEGEKQEGDWIYKEVGENATVTGYAGSGTEISIPATLGGKPVTSIGESAFIHCWRLTSVGIPDSVTSIEEYAFYNCESLTSVSIPGSVTSIGEHAFSSCYSLTSVSIPSSVTRIGDVMGGSVFADCGSLTDIKVDGENPNYSSENGILYDKNKTELIRYPGVKTDVNIPSSVKRIGDWAFSRCGNLTSVSIPGSVTSIGYKAFSGCGSLTSVSIPGSVTNIFACAFEGCRSLTSVSIPSSVTLILSGVFSSCSSLTDIKVDGENPNYSSENGVLYDKNKTELICCPEGKTEVSIPGSVTSIRDGAFENCGSLTSVSIPDSVTSIGNSAFYNCESLTSVTIPSSVTSIGKWAFNLSWNLKDVYYGGSEEQWNKIVIDEDNEDLRSATIHYNSTDPGNEEISLTLDKSSLTFDAIGKSETLIATVTPASQAVTWTSSKPGVATVENGVVTAKGNGTATITATAGDKSARATVTVSQKSKKVSLTLNGQTVSGTLKAKVKKSYTFKTVVTPSNVSAANKKITWSSSNTKVATVKNGKVTIKKAGTVTIKATTADGKSASVKLNASNKAVKVSKVKISSSTGKKTMKVKEKLTLTLTVTPATADNTKVTWSSSNKKVATVDKNGKVTAKKKGTVTITAKAKDGSGKKGTFKIKVTKI